MDVQSHPVVAEIIASFSGHTVPPLPAFEAACKLVTGVVPNEREEVAVDLVAVAVKLHRSMGLNGKDAIAAFSYLAALLIGKVAAEAALVAGGMTKSAAAAVGATIVSRAPEQQKAAAPVVKAKRGLSRPGGQST